MTSSGEQNYYIPVDGSLNESKSSFHIEDFESLLLANEGGSIGEMIVSSPISDKNFDDSKSSMWKEL